MGGSTEPETRKSGFAQPGEYDAYTCVSCWWSVRRR